MAAASFIFLGLAILAIWWPDNRRTATQRLRLWIILFGAAVACGLAGGILNLTAIGGLVILALTCISSRWRFPRTGSWLAGGLALLLALHAWPGFHPLTIVDEWSLGLDTLPFTLRASFDKASAGLFMLAYFCQRIESLSEFKNTSIRVLPIAGTCVAATLGLAWLSGFVRLDPKWPDCTGQFVVINLLFSCVAEEAFFRGLIQERLHQACTNRAKLLPVVFSSILFGTAHLTGGMLYAALASVAGLGYSLAYARTRRIEAAICVHFAVNSVHFLGFSYPSLSG